MSGKNLMAKARQYQPIGTLITMLTAIGLLVGMGTQGAAVVRANEAMRRDLAAAQAQIKAVIDVKIPSIQAKAEAQAIKTQDVQSTQQAILRSLARIEAKLDTIEK